MPNYLSFRYFEHKAARNNYTTGREDANNNLVEYFGDAGLDIVVLDLVTQEYSSEVGI